MGVANPDQLLPVLVVVLLAIAAAVVLRPRPQLGVVVWLVSVAFVPYWLGPTVRVYVPPASALALFLLVVFLPWRGFRLHPGDLVPGILIAIMAVAAAAQSGSLPVAFAFVVEWVSAYLLARVLASQVDLQWIYAAFGIVMAVVAVLTVVEAVTSSNVFVELARANSQYAAWGPLQYRSGLLRAEGAFGHSIALGVSLAVAIPLTLGSRLRSRTKGLIVTLLVVASIATLSRLGMLTAVLGIVLCALFLRSGFTTRQRAVVFTGLAVLVAALTPTVLEVLSRAGNEVNTSSEYRVDLISLLGSMNPVGISPAFARSASGDTSFGGFTSIDSQLILTGLTQGYVALAVVLVALGAAIITVVLGRATAATIAVVALIPAFATVALITQYTAVVWFVIGLAVTGQQRRAAVVDDDTRDVGHTDALDPASGTPAAPAGHGGDR